MGGARKASGKFSQDILDDDQVHARMRVALGIMWCVADANRRTIPHMGGEGGYLKDNYRTGYSPSR